MSISIIKAKPGCSIQDEGRFGYQAYGINPGGAMDITAMHIANALLGNSLGEAVIEFVFPAPVFHFQHDSFIALSGADFGAFADNLPIPIHHPVFIPANTNLRFTKKVHGNFGYLSIQGGLVLSEWLGSYSTNKKVNAGGLNGGDLQEGDILPTKQQQRNSIHQTSAIMPWQADIRDFYEPIVYCTPAPEMHALTNASTWYKNVSFSILPNSDRMGYRLNGGFFDIADTEIISSAVTRGTIQLPPNKQPIVLMADHQTTGGYARIATVCTTSLSKLVQQTFHEPFMIDCIAIKEAEEKWNRQHRHLLILQQACTLRIKESFHAY